MKSKLAVAFGVIGLVAALFYRIRYEMAPTPFRRQRELEDLIRACASEDADVYA